LRIDEPVFWLVCRARGVPETVRSRWDHKMLPVSSAVYYLTGVDTACWDEKGRWKSRTTIRNDRTGWRVRWDVLGKCADALGVPAEMLVDEEFYVRRTRGWTPYRVVCEAYRKGVKDLVDIMPPPARRGFLTRALAKAYKAFFQGHFYNSGSALCRRVSEDGFYYYGSLHFSHVLWTLETLGIPMWMLAAPFKRVPGVLGATEADAAISTLWRALTHEDRAAVAGIMKVLVERRGVDGRLEGIKEVLEAVEEKRAAQGA
jgi:hypothetical protein